MNTFDLISEHYDRGRLGYSNDIYNALVGYGLAPSHAILDLGCGTGLASAPLIENGYHVTGVDPSEPMLAIAKRNLPSGTWQSGSAESLPFKDRSFDVVVSGQAFHRMEPETAMAEVRRVLRPGGIVGIWWKSLVTGDPIKEARLDVGLEMGVPKITTQHPPFKAFYAAKWKESALRVLPWRTSTTLSSFLEYERSRAVVHEQFSNNVEAYISNLEERLHALLGPGDPLVPLSYSQFLYLAKK
jgi:ubiquinone/menaquinone biosynthesis C-methylase UbiE